MEEAWEPAVVSGLPTFTDWSGRHTRLRYQCVLSALTFFMVAKYGVKSVGIPGFVILDNTPSENWVLIGLLVFCAYSCLSFRYQHKLENRVLSTTSTTLSNIPAKIVDKYEWKHSEENAFEVIQTAIARAASSKGTVSGGEAITGIDTEAYSFSVQNIKQYRSSLKQSAYLADELEKIFPNQNSPGMILASLHRYIIELFDDLSLDLDFISNKIWTNATIPTSQLRILNTKLNALNNVEIANPNLMTAIESEISEYVSDRKVHSEILPFIVPLSTSVGLLLIGSIFWLPFL